MNVRTPIVVLIDVRCKIDSCICQRTVPARFKGKGKYAYPENEPICPGCGHPYERHEVIGETRRRLVHRRTQK